MKQILEPYTQCRSEVDANFIDNNLLSGNITCFAKERYRQIQGFRTTVLLNSVECFFVIFFEYSTLGKSNSKVHRGARTAWSYLIRQKDCFFFNHNEYNLKYYYRIIFKPLEYVVFYERTKSQKGKEWPHVQLYFYELHAACVLRI